MLKKNFSVVHPYTRPESVLKGEVVGVECSRGKVITGVAVCDSVPTKKNNFTCKLEYIPKKKTKFAWIFTFSKENVKYFVYGYNVDLVKKPSEVIEAENYFENLLKLNDWAKTDVTSLYFS